MSSRSRALVVQIVLAQTLATVATYAIAMLFAPRVLVLPPSAEAPALFVLLQIGGLSLVASLVATGVLVGPLKGTLRSLGEGDGFVPPSDLLRLHALPIRLSVINVVFVIASAMVASLPFVRPRVLDAQDAIALGLLLATMRATAGLPEYVTMRARITRTLELASVRSSREALRHPRGAVPGRVRRRFVAAVTAPVAFIALGASLLVEAHVRADERNARADDAVALARAVFDSAPSTEAGRAAASERGNIDPGLAAAEEAARAEGFVVTLSPERESASRPDLVDDGDDRVVVPSALGTVVVRFTSSEPSPVALLYILLAAASVAMAAFLGIRVGGAFETDVALATHEIRRAGVADVMRGTLIQNEGRFAKVDALLHAIDALGGVFREFASAQERAIDARAATERMRGLLLASMSHDLKAPLNAVLGFAELVGRSPLSEGQRESLSIIDQRGRELLMLIDTILDSARVEAGELEVSPAPTSINDVVMAAVLEVRSLGAGALVPIRAEVQAGIPYLVVDGLRLVQALSAVLTTAAQFSAQGAVEVRASLSDNAEWVRLEVEGSGEALPEADRDKIFDAFKSAESARRHGALGLGLQLARSILEIHGGGVDVDDGVTSAIRFRLWLPCENDGGSIRERASRRFLPDPE